MPSSKARDCMNDASSGFRRNRHTPAGLPPNGLSEKASIQLMGIAGEGLIVTTMLNGPAPQ